MGRFHPRLWVGCLPIVSFDEQRCLLCVTGDEDRATQSLRRRPLSRALLAVRKELVVDLSGLSFADSSLMIDLAMLARRARKAGGRLVLRDAQPHIQRLIEIVGLDRFPAVFVAAPSTA